MKQIQRAASRDVDLCQSLHVSRHIALATVLFLVELLSNFGQAQTVAPHSPATAQTDEKNLAGFERRLDDLTGTLLETQKALQESLAEIQRLRSELNSLHAQTVPDDATAALFKPAIESQRNSSNEAEIQALREQLDILQAEIKQHEQTKIETASKYNLRVTGLALFNAFSNAGVVDNVELPAIALSRVPGSSHGSAGATLRQTIFGISASGPVIAGAHSSAFVNVDFFGGATSNSYGYSAAAGYVRMRDAQLGLDWRKNTVQVGYTVPLISPLSPTSYATIAQPALSASGNLWVWSPQVRFEQRVPLSDNTGLSLEGGLIYPASPGYNAIQFDSPVEASRRPAYEGRVAYHGPAGLATSASPRSFTLGLGGYGAKQFYSSTVRVRSWAITGDWQVPISRWIDLSGEVYRGRALGGLGGGQYKDVLTGTDYKTGLSRTVGVDTAGGWAQLKLKISPRLQSNAIFGLDDAFASTFDSVVLLASSDPTAMSARNSSVIGNLIFRPRSSLILSPEYRRIISWQYTGSPNTANIFTLSAGYQF